MLFVFVLFSFLSFFSPLFDLTAACYLFYAHPILPSLHCLPPHSFLSLSLWSRMLFDNCFQKNVFLFYFSFPLSLSASVSSFLARSFHRNKKNSQMEYTSSCALKGELYTTSTDFGWIFFFVPINSLYGWIVSFDVSWCALNGCSEPIDSCWYD